MTSLQVSTRINGDAADFLCEPEETLLDVLRDRLGLTGAKEGCGTGDCGACSVTVDGRLVCACLMLGAEAEGREIATIEGLAEGERLHPLQEKFLEHAALQCGICTPGFLVAAKALLERNPDPDETEIRYWLAGNLCRCTGYGPIVAAARRMGAAEAEDESALAATLEGLAGGEGLSLAAAGRRYFAPKSVEALAALLLEHPEACVLAGGTDVGLWVTKQHRRLDPIVYVGEVAELKALTVGPERIEIGAAVTYSEAHQAIAEAYPDFGEVIRRLGSRQIRNLGTIGGNIANGSPIGDSPPPLIALDARLVLRRGAERREIALEDFFIAYGAQDRQPGEFVERVLLPRQGPDWDFRCYKVSKRFDQDITAVLGAFNLKREGGRVAAARICYGGMAATPKRASACEAALTGFAWDEATLERGRQALAEDFAPISDMRASADYRLRAAQNLLTKVYVETTAPATATRLVGEGRVAYG